jgi:hypothetical protein
MSSKKKKSKIEKLDSIKEELKDLQEEMEDLQDSYDIKIENNSDQNNDKKDEENYISIDKIKEDLGKNDEEK